MSEFFSLRLVERLNRPDKKKIVVNDVIVNTRGMDEKKVHANNFSYFFFTLWVGGPDGKIFDWRSGHTDRSARKRLTTFPDRLSSTRRASSTSAFALIFASVAVQFF